MLCPYISSYHITVPKKWQFCYTGCTLCSISRVLHDHVCIRQSLLVPWWLAIGVLSLLSAFGPASGPTVVQEPQRLSSSLRLPSPLELGWQERPQLGNLMQAPACPPKEPPSTQP